MVLHLWVVGMTAYPTGAERMAERYDKGRVPVPALPSAFHLHYLAVRGHPRWVVATRRSYICQTPRCKPMMLHQWGLKVATGANEPTYIPVLYTTCWTNRRTWRHGLAEWLYRHCYWAYSLWAWARPCPCGCFCQSCEMGCHRGRIWRWRVRWEVP